MKEVVDKKWLIFRKLKFDKNYVKIIVQSLLLTGIGIVIGIVDFSNFEWSRKTIWLVAVTAALVVAYIASVIIYKRFDAYMEQLKTEQSKIFQETISELEQKINAITAERDSLEKESDCYSLALRTIKALHTALSENVENQISIHSGSKIDKSEIYSNIQLSSILCSSVHKLLAQKFGSEQDFEVTYVRMNPATRTIEMTAFANYNDDSPSILLQQRPIPKRKNKNRKKYCFEELLQNGGKVDPLVLPTKDEILEKFLFKNNEAKENCKYEQYIGVPVYRSKSSKPIGLLQIVSFRADAMGGRKDMTKFTCDVLTPFAYTSLLAMQSEKLSEAFEQHGKGVTT